MYSHASLNRIYRLVWSAVHQTWVVASELAGGRGKSSSTPLLSAALLASLAGLSGGAGAAPQGGQVVGGSGSISTIGATTTITQASDKLSLNWQSFNVGKTETVNFVQPSASALAVNRIFDTQGSQILGRINANGQVWLINPNGVLFGKDAQINVGGLVASTLNPDDASIGSARSNFSGTSTAGVVNFGQINAAQGGYVALLGHSVSNQGSISAPGGTVALGAGSAVSLNFAGSKLLGLEVTSNQVNALAENGGLIQADGGQVLLSAGARDSLLASVVNNTGVIQARTVQEQDGKIILLGGMAAGATKVKGTLDASAPNGGNGGFIETSAYAVNVDDSAKITTASAQGTQGQWLLDPFDFYVKSSGGNITGAALSTALGNNNVTIQTVASANPTLTGATASGSYTSGLGDIYVNDAVSWSANYTLTLNAYNSIYINNAITATGASGKLALLYGQASSNGGSANYFVNAPVSLQAGANFSTKLGSTGTTKNYTVITSLGNAGDENLLSATNSLQGLAYYISPNSRLSGNYVLGAEIDASGTSTWNSGSGFSPIANFGANSSAVFYGTFDGLGHTVSGLTINRPNTDFVGLFGILGIGAVVKNVGVTSASVVGASNVGALVGFMHGAVSNSYSTGSISANTNSFGGLAGGSAGTISNSYSAVNVTGIGSIGNISGGLVGLNGGTVTNSYATGTVGGVGGIKGGLVGRAGSGDTASSFISNSYATGAVSGISSIGGLVGEMERRVSTHRAATVSNSYATGAVTATGTFAGGLVGQSYGIVTSSYATGSVGGSGGIKGGLVGRNTDLATISNSYATGAVSGSYTIGGLVGDVLRAVSATDVVTSGTVSDSYATGAVSATAGDAGGLVGSSRGNISNSYATGTVGGTGSVGGLAGYSGYGTISNSYATGVVSGGTTGGLVGYMDNSGAVSSSYATGSVTGTGYTGGLLGNLVSGTIANSYATGAVSGSQRVGGLVGNSAGAISSSYATGTVSGTTVVGGLVGNQDLGSIDASYATGAVSASTGYAGGLVGDNDGTISSSYATGAVSAATHAGGLVGINNASISSSYATGTVNSTGTNTHVGGLIGAANQLSVVSNSYATGAVTGVWLVGGLMGYLSGSLSGSYATGAVTGVSGAIRVGGLMGSLLSGGTISDSYATGAVSGGAYRGGLVGNVYSTTNYSISNTYATGVVSSSGATFYGGLVGRMEATGTGSVTNSYWNSDNTSSAGSGSAGTGLSTAAMKTASNFSAWSMSTAGGSSSTWFTYDGYTAPLLRSFLTPLSATYSVSGSKTYDGTTACGAITCSYTTGTLTSGKNLLGTSSLAVSSKNAGSVAGAGLYSDQQGYEITASTNGTATITKAPLTITGNSASTTYTGVAQTLTGYTASGLLGSDTASSLSGVSASASGTNAGSYTNSVTASTQTNYTVTTANGTFTISKKALTVSGTSASGKTYNGNTTAAINVGTLSGFVNSETVSATASGTFNNQNAGSRTATASYTLVNGTGLASNYSLANTTHSATIAQKALTVSGSTAAGKTYDGSTTAAINVGTLSGFVNSETVSATASGTFNNQNAGSRTATASYTLVNGTGLASNYSLANTTHSATIAQKALTATVAAPSKTYDGSTTASPTLTITSGLVGTETVKATGTASFNSKDVATANLVTVNSTSLANGTNGGLASNYSLAGGETVAANITAKALTYAATAASFGTGTTPTGLRGTLSGFVSNETQSTATTGTLAWLTPATSASGAGSYAINGSGLLADNYTFSQAGGNATALTLTRAAASVVTPTQATSFVPVIVANPLPGDTRFTRTAEVALTAKQFGATTKLNLLAPTGAGPEQATASSNISNATQPLGESGLLYVLGNSIKMPDVYFRATNTGLD